jgi:hypothetical protein
VSQPPYPPRWRCPRCHANNMPQSPTCHQCGAAQPQATWQPAPPVAPHYQTPPRRRLSPWLIGALALAGGLCLLPAGCIAFLAAVGSSQAGRTGQPAPVSPTGGGRIEWITTGANSSTGRLHNLSSVPWTRPRIEATSVEIRDASGFPRRDLQVVRGYLVDDDKPLRPGQWALFTIPASYYGLRDLRLIVNRQEIPVTSEVSPISEGP